MGLCFLVLPDYVSESRMCRGLFGLDLAREA